jgi:hypothetical protein
MPFCPQCKYEYKPMVEFCPDCGKRLVAELNENKRAKAKVKKITGERIEPKLKLLYISKSRIHADFLKETLEKNKIPCMIRSESGYNLRIGGLIRHPVTDIKIYVRGTDFPKSLKIKEQLVDNL